MWMNVCLFVCFHRYIILFLFFFRFSRLPNTICCIWISVDIHLASRCAPDLNRSIIIIAFKHEIATAITCLAFSYIEKEQKRQTLLGIRSHMLSILHLGTFTVPIHGQRRETHDSHVLIPVEIFCVLLCCIISFFTSLSLVWNECITWTPCTHTHTQR